jgi:single-stranded DNA-binding protein
MPGSLNKVQLIGKLGRDPESRSFSNGGKVVELRVATLRNMERQEQRRAQGAH